MWHKELASWIQRGERITRLHEQVEFVKYLPGSIAGVPVSILKSFAAPPRAETEELLGERFSTTVTSLLGSLGMKSGPLKSRGHILISLLLTSPWKEQREMDIPASIQQIQTPSRNG